MQNLERTTLDMVRNDLKNEEIHGKNTIKSIGTR